MAKRKTSTDPTRIYTYGLPVGPTSGAEAVGEQLGLARGYRNNLLAVELARRAAYRAITADVPDVAAIDERIGNLRDEREALRKTIKARSKSSRRRVPADREDRERIRQIGVELKAAKEERKEARARASEIKRTDIRAMEERVAVMVKSLRAHYSGHGLCWGTYLLVEKSAEQWRKGNDPRFRRWDGSGRIGVQIQKSRPDGELQNGMPVSMVYDCTDTRLQIDRTPILKHTRRHPEGRTIPRSGTLRIRVGSDGRAPVWAEFPVILHRALPEDGTIKGAWVIRRRVGRRWRWDLQIQVEAPSFRPAPIARTPQTVAIDLGCRGADSGYQVALALDEAGGMEHLSLDRVDKGKHTIRARLEHAESLRSIRDREFNEKREWLSAWLIANDTPDWLREALRHMPQWRSTEKLHRVVERWAGERFNGDERIFATMRQWAAQDRHLHQWEADERQKAIARRTNAYRVWARRLAERYQTAVIEKIDRRQPIRRAKPEDEDASSQYANWLRRAAAVGSLADAIKHAFGDRCTALEPSGRASRCPKCGANAETRDGYLWCAADTCGARVEEDFARCWHLLADQGIDVTPVRERHEQAEQWIRETGRMTGR